MICDFVCVHAGHLGRHLKIHSGEKSYKCNQCDYASVEASDLKSHLKKHPLEKNRINATNVTMPLIRPAI